MKGTVAIFSAALFVLAAASPASSEVTITLNLDRSEATLVDSMILSVSVSGAHGDAARPSIQGLEDFLVRQAGASTRVEIVNGAYSAGTDFSYLVQPKKTGKFNIGPAILAVGGTTYRSNVVTVAIGQPVASPAGDRGPVFLVATLAPGKVYVEQQALYTLKLYRSVNIADVSVDLPEADGVTIAKIGEPREYQGLQHGRPYQIIEVRYLVTPQKAGRHLLKPARMELTAFAPRSRPRRGIFDDPFFGSGPSGRPMALVSEALPFEVLPLPAEGRPADYGGLVGSFTLESTLEPLALRAGESATLTATIRGRGNVKRIPELKIPPLDGLKVYADQPLLRDEPSAEGVAGSKTMKWAVVPEKEGRYLIPALAMSYFDTTAGRYRTLKTTEATLTVAPGRGEQAVAARATAANADILPGREVAELGSDILPVHATIGRPASGLSALPGAGVFWLLLIGPPAAFFLTLGTVAVRRRSGLLSEAWSVRNAAAAFTSTCGRRGLTAEALLLGLQEYLGQRLGLARGSLTADEAAAHLRARHVGDDLVGELQAVWRRIEDAIYTGSGRETTDAGEVLARLVARIEKDLR